jgi:septum site-determining protein MinC
MLSLRLLAPGAPDFFPLLLDKVAHSPDFFRSAPVVLDVATLAGQPPIDLAAFVEQLRQHRLMPVGIQNGGPDWNEAALRAGLALFGAGGNAAAPEPAGPRAPARLGAAASPQPAAAEPPRRGPGPNRRRDRARRPADPGPDGDLVVAATVGHGAEVAAAGHVHVYGTCAAAPSPGSRATRRHDLLRPARGRAGLDRGRPPRQRGDRP